MPKEKKRGHSDIPGSMTTLPDSSESLTIDQQTALKTLVQSTWSYYRTHRRILPWREQISAYGVFVSEVMLQQTQVHRVTDKYLSFLRVFPDWHMLASASTTEVLAQWQGLGYNRRGLYLHRAAQQIVDEHDGMLPADQAAIDALPGIGPATAAAITCYVWNIPTVFIETNVRRVFLHHCFPGQEDITDRQLQPLVAAAVRFHSPDPREWYYALMDYGSFLAKTVPNPNRRSRHYVKQSRFEGSDRQIRGMILRHTLADGLVDRSGILSAVQKSLDDLGQPFDLARVERILAQMIAEEMISLSKNYGKK